MRKKADWYTDENSVREHYDAIAPRYARHWNSGTAVSHFFNMRKRRVLEMLTGIPPENVLDVGCGPGVMVSPLLEPGFNYEGVDLSEGMIAECDRHYSTEPNAQFAVARGQELPFPDQSFRVVLCLGALEYVNDVDQVVSEMKRVLRSDGILLISMLHRHSPYRIAERLFRNWIEPCNQFTKRFANKLLISQGLEEIDCVFYDFNLLPRPLDQDHPRVSLAVSQRCEFLSRGPLRWLGTGFIVKARLCNRSTEC